MAPDLYAQRGVSSGKEDVHNSISTLDKGLYPKAFCKILPDYFANRSDYCSILHVDTAGTKTALAYLYWRETGDLSVWNGIVQDALVMNLDDMACAGAYSGFVVASNIARNKFRIPGEVVQTLIQHTQAYLELLSNWGVDAQLAGGETADVGDVVRTVDVGFTLACTLPRAHVLEVNPKPGDVIVGLSSAGQAVYESEYNSGIGCNGLTSARHDLFSHLYYSRYPETVSPETPETVAYQGKYLVTDTIDIQGASFTLGKLALSPTRTFLPVLSKLIPELRGQLHGIVHNTGGGQTKVLHFAESVHIIKDQLLQVPPIFWEIQRAMDTPWYEMFRTFNMGQRLEIYLPPNFAQTAIAIAAEFGIEAQVVGRVEASPNKRLSIDWQGHHLEYQ